MGIIVGYMSVTVGVQHLGEFSHNRWEYAAATSIDQYERDILLKERGHGLNGEIGLAISMVRHEGTYVMGHLLTTVEPLF